jgi:hypothetical protein
MPIAEDEERPPRAGRRRQFDRRGWNLPSRIQALGLRYRRRLRIAFEMWLEEPHESPLFHSPAPAAAGCFNWTSPLRAGEDSRPYPPPGSVFRLSAMAKTKPMKYAAEHFSSGLDRAAAAALSYSWNGVEPRFRPALHRRYATTRRKHRLS